MCLVNKSPAVDIYSTIERGIFKLIGDTPVYERMQIRLDLRPHSPPHLQPTQIFPFRPSPYALGYLIIPYTYLMTVSKTHSQSFKLYRR